MLHDYFVEQFAYNEWANRTVLQSLLELTSVPARASRIAAHIVGAEWLWLERLKVSGKQPPVWPESNSAEALESLAKVSKEWQQYLAQPPLNRNIEYTNSQGETFQNLPLQVLTHVLYHGAYHRGQIAALVRQAGQQPVYTDYIHAVRTGQLKR